MLTDTALKLLKPQRKPYKRGDEKGLFVIVRPDGALWWRFKYRFQGREKQLSLGTYPDTSLKLAREKRDDARRLLAAHVDPSVNRQIEKAERSHTFETVAREWLGKLQLSPDTVAQLRHRLETYVFLHLGRYPIKTIVAADLLRVLRRIEANGTHETAHRVRSVCSRVFRYAVVCEKADRDPAADLIGALVPVRGKNFAALTDPKEVGALLRAIEDYKGQVVVAAALKLAPLVFVRPAELRGAEWKEFNLDSEEPEWRIPAERMKMREQHIVPLSKQAKAILLELRTHASDGPLLFPSLRSNKRPISDNSINAALRRLGYRKDQQTGHGFRTIASTLLNELGFNPDVIERQLAHLPRNKVRAAYNRAEWLAERRRMMQAWADYLDVLRDGGKLTVVQSKEIAA